MKKKRLIITLITSILLTVALITGAAVGTYAWYASTFSIHADIHLENGGTIMIYFELPPPTSQGALHPVRSSAGILQNNGVSYPIDSNHPYLLNPTAPIFTYVTYNSAFGVYAGGKISSGTPASATLKAGALIQDELSKGDYEDDLLTRRDLIQTGELNCTVSVYRNIARTQLITTINNGAEVEFPISVDSPVYLTVRIWIPTWDVVTAIDLRNSLIDFYLIVFSPAVEA
ncbi:MAG: hypothetical protein FWD49_01905 [Firmicutes bacterium]|nr:hypothetical protein [Bacillota bacterium]